MMKILHENAHSQIFCAQLNQGLDEPSAENPHYEVIVASHGAKSGEEVDHLFFADGYVKKVKAHETHGISMWDVDKGLSDPRGCDGLLSTKTFTALTIYAADCLPVMLWAKKEASTPVLAAIHCGWRSLANGIVEVAMEKMIQRGKIHPKDIHAFLCPCIGKCCYNVREDFLQAFQPAMMKHRLNIDHYLSSPDKNVFSFDLVKCCEDFLRQQGVEKKAIFFSGRCTKCSLEYRSYRRDGIKEQNYSFIFSRPVKNLLKAG